MRSRFPSSRQSGQALLETVMVGALLSLAMALALIWSKLQSIDQASAAATRAVAFECAAARSACSTAARGDGVSRAVLRRLLGEGDRQVLSGDTMSSEHDRSVTRSFWTGLDGQPLLTSPIASLPTRGTQRFDAGFNVASRAHGTFPGSADLLDQAGPGRFGLDPRAGLEVTRLQLQTLTIWPGPSGAATPSRQALSFRGRSAILADAWNASDVEGDSSGSVSARVRRASRLQPSIEAALGAGYQLSRSGLRTAAAVGLEPLGRHFKPGAVDVTIVPSDRVVER
jgi:hypothetical protein